MTQKTRPFLCSATAFLLTLLMLLSLLPIQAFAAGTVYEGTVELTGSFNGKFSLDSSDSKLFALENIVPGDSWRGKLHVVNKGNAKMEISIISIESNLEDNTLYDALDLNISVDGEELYSGSYGATPTPITGILVIPAESSMTFDLTVTLPVTAGNELMGKAMDSTWTFEAKHYGTTGDVQGYYKVFYVDEDGKALLPSKSGSNVIGATVTERAEDIEGYTPDEEVKSIVISASTKKNNIVFVYSKDKAPDDPVDPTDPVDPVDPVDPTDPVDPDPTDPVDPDPSTPVDPDPADPVEPDPVDPTEPTEPTEPDDPTPDKPKEEIKTGVDMTQSNTGPIIWLVVLAMSGIAAATLYVRVKAERKHATTSSGKEDNNHEENHE